MDLYKVPEELRVLMIQQNKLPLKAYFEHRNYKDKLIPPGGKRYQTRVFYQMPSFQAFQRVWDTLFQFNLSK